MSIEQLNPGETYLRKEIHAVYGGRQQGGIGPSTKTPTVLFFTDPVTGQRHGYDDGWDDDGLFNYTGEGQRGDQRLVQGNKAILTHQADGRTLKGFKASGSQVTFIGDFDYVDHHFTDAFGTDGIIRQAVVFRLRPRDSTTAVPLPSVLVTTSDQPKSEMVPIEEQHTERAMVTPDREPYEFERREAALVTRYADHLRRQGHTVGRLRVVPPGEATALYSDLWDETTGTLVEAKGLVTREQLRMAVGQLLDYGRFVDHQNLAVLVPTQPRADLTAYLDAHGIAAVYPTADGWAETGTEVSR